MKKRKFIALQIVVSVGLLVFIVSRVGLMAIIDGFTAIHFNYLVPILLMMLLFMALSGINLFLLYRTKCAIPFFEFAKRYFLTKVIGEYTPGRVGDFSLVVFLKKYDIKTSYSVFFVLLDKVINVLVWFILFLVSSFILRAEIASYFSGVSMPRLYAGIVLACLLILLLVGIFFRSGITELLMKSIRYLYKYAAVIGINIAITFLKAFVAFIFLYFMFLSFNLQPPLIYIVFSSSFINFFNVLPISIGGLGIREFIYSTVYPLVGISAASAVAVALTVPIVSVIVNVLIMAIFMFCRFLPYSFKHRT